MLAYTRACWATNSPNSRIRLEAELNRAHQEIALLQGEPRIHKLRMVQIRPHRRADRGAEAMRVSDKEI